VDNNDFPRIPSSDEELLVERPRKIVDKYNMDGHKMLWHLDRVAEWQSGKRIAPLHIDLGISTGCNMACTYCYGFLQGRSGYGTDKKGRFNMPREAVLRLFSDAKETGVRSIALIGEGENTLHPDLDEIVQVARTRDLDLSLATNAVRLDKFDPANLLSGLKWLRVNISAATPESFQQIHQVSQLDRVLRNVRELVEVKKSGGHDCTIGLQMVVTKENFNDIAPLAKLGQDLGVDYFVVKSCSDTYDGLLDAPRDGYQNIHDILLEAESYSTDTYTVSVKWHKITNCGWKDYDICYGTQFILNISGDGSVFPCGHWFNFNREEFLMGNIIETSFAEILASDRYKEVQDKIQTVNVNRDCESNCRQHYVNRFLWEISNPVTHQNFV